MQQLGILYLFWAAALGAAEQAVLTDDACLPSKLLWADATCEGHVSHQPAPAALASPSDDEWATIQASWEKTVHCHWNTCVYFNHLLGGGSVVITDSHNADIIASFPPPLGTAPAVPPFQEVEIPGKGMGLVANRTILKGETVMMRLAVMMVQETVHREMESEVRDALYDIAAHRLSDGRRVEFDRQVGDGVGDRVDRNAFQMSIDGKNETGAHLGLWTDVSRFNHDCRPNVQYHINNMTHTTIAVRDISPGEELTISYIDSSLVRAERQERLSSWGFECTCQQCALAANEVAVSDARLRHIDALLEDLESPNSTTVSAESGAEMVALYHEERLDIYLGHAYTRASLNYALFAKEEKARQYARLAVEALLREFGPTCGDLPGMRAMIENPRKHWAWGKRLTRKRL